MLFCYLKSMGTNCQWTGMRGSSLLQAKQGETIKYKNSSCMCIKTFYLETGLHSLCSEIPSGAIPLCKLQQRHKEKQLMWFEMYEHYGHLKDRLTYEDLLLMDLAQLFHAEWVGLHISWRPMQRQSDQSDILYTQYIL